jgi:hypothetical protein
MKKPLYAITQEYIQAYNALFSDEELPEDAIRDTLDGIQDEFEAKALNIAALIKNMQADVNAMKDAETSINERRMRLEKCIKDIKRYLLINMQGSGFENKTIESPEHYIKLSRCPESVKIDDEAIIPDDFMRIVPEKKEPDKDLIKMALRLAAASGKDELVGFKGVSLIRNIKLTIK